MDDEHGATDKGWGLALSIITLITIAFVQYSHTNPTLQAMIIGQKYEGIIILVLLLFSTILVGIVSGPNRGLAVDKDGAVNVGNMYYSCWAGFVNCFAILSSFIVFSFVSHKMLGHTMSSFVSFFITRVCVSKIYVPFVHVCVVYQNIQQL